MTELQKLARAVASAREVAHDARLELAAANAQAATLTAAAKKAKAAVKAARKQAKSAKHAAKSARAQAATAAKVFSKAAKKAVKLERTFGAMKQQRQPAKAKASATHSKARPRVAAPLTTKQFPLPQPAVADPADTAAATPAC